MLAIERVEEIKKDNPELKDYSTYFISDSQYVVNSFIDWIFNWVKINKYNTGVWLSRSKSPIMYQWIIKHIYNNYISDEEWRQNNLFLHTNGHVNYCNISDLRLYHKKFVYKNYILDITDRMATLDEYADLVKMNGEADKLAEKIRSNKLFYFEEREDGLPWEIRRKRIPTRNQRIVIKSRKNESKI